MIKKLLFYFGNTFNGKISTKQALFSAESFGQCGRIFGFGRNQIYQFRSYTIFGNTNCTVIVALLLSFNYFQMCETKQSNDYINKKISTIPIKLPRSMIQYPNCRIDLVGGLWTLPRCFKMVFFVFFLFFLFFVSQMRFYIIICFTVLVKSIKVKTNLQKTRTNETFFKFLSFKKIIDQNK